MDTQQAKKPRGAARRTRGAESSRRVLSMLAWFDPERPFATIDTLAGVAGVPKSTAYRYVSLLRETGFLAEDGRGAYHVAPRVLQLARAAEAAISVLDIAQPLMEKLSGATGETVILVRRVGDHAVCFGRAESNRHVRLSFEVGTAFPLHLGASPKTLLAHLPARERDAYLTRAARADATLRTRMARFEQELDRIRAEGVAVSSAEITEDVWAVAAPVWRGEQLAAALSVAGPAFRLRGTARTRAAALTREAALDISSAIARARIGTPGRMHGC